MWDDQYFFAVILVLLKAAIRSHDLKNTNKDRRYKCMDMHGHTLLKLGAKDFFLKSTLSERSIDNDA